MKQISIVTLSLCSLAACTPSNNSADNVDGNAVLTGQTANSSGESVRPGDPTTDASDPSDLASNRDSDTGTAIPVPPETAAAATIPAQYRGRWGLVAADCTSQRGDAKGLMIIADKVIRFYESTATLKEQRPAIATSFSGLFAFTGEGQAWQKVETLTRTGHNLKRADDEGSFSYKRCA